MYFKEFDEIYVRINEGIIVVFDSYGKFLTQKEFDEYHDGYFSRENCKEYFLKEVKNKLAT